MNRREFMKSAIATVVVGVSAGQMVNIGQSAETGMPIKGGVMSDNNSPVIIVEPAKGYNSWPMLQALGKRLVCVYSCGTIHDPGEKGRGVFVRISDDEGATWSEKITVTNNPLYGETAVAKGLDLDGAMLLWVRRYGPKDAFVLYRTTDGTHFTQISSPELSPFPMQIMDVIHLPGGVLFSLWFGGSYKDDNVNRWGTLVSHDNGHTWIKTTVREGTPMADWASEPGVVHIGNGRLLATARAGSRGKQFQLTSIDYGKTWTVADTNIDDVNASTPSLIFDEKNGLSVSIITTANLVRSVGVPPLRMKCLPRQPIGRRRKSSLMMMGVGLTAAM